MKHRNAQYVAQVGSIAYQVLSFLIENPEEELRADDIVIKFGGNTSNMSTYLGRAITCGAIDRKHGVYRLGNATTAAVALGQDGEALRTKAAATTQVAVAAMTATAARQPNPSINDEPGEAWNAAAAAVRGSLRDKLEQIATPMTVTLPTGAVVHLEEAPYQSPRRVSSISALDLVIGAIAATRPAPGRTVRCALPEGVTDRFAAGALRRWHIRHGHRTRLVEIVRIRQGDTVTALLQRAPVTA